MMKIEFPNNIELEEADSLALAGLNDAEIAARQYLQAVQEGAEKRLSNLQSEGRKIWSALGEKYDLPLETVSYTLSRDGKTLVATMAKTGD